MSSPVQWLFADGTVFWTGRNSGSAVAGLYTNWASASPSDGSGSYCATMNNAGGNVWVDRRCTNLQPYVCEAY